jgi:predicted esterase
MTHSDEEIKRIMTWLREVLEKLGISQLSSVGGFSQGAYLTCRIALNAPDILASNAALFIAAPPASLSKFRFSYILPLTLQGNKTECRIKYKNYNRRITIITDTN